MRRQTTAFCLAALLSLACSASLAADKPAGAVVTRPCATPRLEALRHHDKPGCRTCPTWCKDDYCPKCPPPICLPTYCGACDCYQRKRPPPICLPTYCGACDCYQRKRPPPICPPTYCGCAGHYVPNCPPCVTFPCFSSFYKCAVHWLADFAQDQNHQDD